MSRNSWPLRAALHELPRRCRRRFGPAWPVIVEADLVELADDLLERRALRVAAFRALRAAAPVSPAALASAAEEAAEGPFTVFLTDS
jgi:hypothetical protein